MPHSLNHSAFPVKFSDQRLVKQHTNTMGGGANQIWNSITVYPLWAAMAVGGAARTILMDLSSAKQAACMFTNTGSPGRRQKVGSQSNVVPAHMLSRVLIECYGRLCLQAAPVCCIARSSDVHAHEHGCLTESQASVLVFSVDLLLHDKMRLLSDCRVQVPYSLDA